MDTVSLFPEFDNKRCSKCERVLPATSEYFPPNKTSRGGLHTTCRVCASARAKAYYQQNKDLVKSKVKKYAAENSEKIAQYQKQYAIDRQELLKEYKKQYHLENREEILEGHKQYYVEHKEQFSEYGKRKRAENPEKKREQDRKYREEHAKEKLERDRKYKEEHRVECCEYSREYYEEHKDERLEYSKQYYQTEQGIIAKRTSSHNRRARKKKADGKHTSAQLRILYDMQEGKCFYCKCEIGHSRNSWHADHYMPLSKGGTNDISNIVIACPTCNLKKNDRFPDEWRKEVIEIE